MKLKSVIGIFLIIASMAAMYMWETVFRDNLILTDVLVAAKDIENGETITADCIKTISVTRESLVEGVLAPEYISSVLNKVSITSIKENSQICKEDFASKDKLDAEGTYTVFISSDWIFEKNSELRAGDIVSIYLMPNQEYVGMYQVKCMDAEDDAFVEIQCPLADYFKMLAVLYEDKESSLLFISERSL